MMIGSPYLSMVREAFERSGVDDSFFWIVEKTVQLGDFGREEAYPASVLESDGLACHVVKISQNSPALERVMAKSGTAEGYRLFYSSELAGLSEKEGVIVLVRSPQGDQAYSVCFGTEEAPESLRNARRSAILVKLEAAPEIEVIA